MTETKQTIKDQQWLRWIHEATVAEVAETADGPIVLTFETALPYDAPRLSAQLEEYPKKSIHRM